MTPPLSDSSPPPSTDTPSAVAERSGSSFYWPMRLLPASKRAAMFAIYAFCRRVDDIADEPGDPAEKREALDSWRRTIRGLYSGDAPTSPLSAALKGAIDRYGLPRAEFEAVIDGMAMDVGGEAGDGLRAPGLPTLRLYCRRVAGAVGMLAIRVFHRADPATEAFALALGEALQLTNILRDLAEDAALGRLYLPRELLDAAGVDTDVPDEALAHPGLPRACEALAELAETRFAEARAAIAGTARGSLWAAIAMMVLYHRLLRRLRARGWSDPAVRIRLGRRESAWVALRCLIGVPPAA
ncbi:phytoene synthase [Azospirillum agricola]|uniref:presqualene diphosphate synthase HpnD n=1 Tax=Azospirillum agricola TaxID=1720247 RepID=UPI001AE75B69|nr:presqualene diphosphate synthase HpnD [Azospirillum agricola]MBP2227297.1 phytoene synthase [Azospirillum agricola]